MTAAGDEIELMLCGDVMLGRGIDQILPHPGDPLLFEPYLRSAQEYVTLAERVHGAISRPVPFAYVWGDALGPLAARAPDLRIINLETAVTRRGKPEPKGINYRMTPENLPALQAAGIDCCVLANNHVLDWGEEGLSDTLASLAGAGLASVGAGLDLEAASAPANFTLSGGRRVLVWSFASLSSGVPRHWGAAAERPGVNLLRDLSDRTAARIAAQVRAEKRPGDLALVSIHWGGNWGYDISSEEQRFAHSLIEAGVEVVHGHSSHHPKAIELHERRVILYGCGDFLNDYEGISGCEPYRGDLVLLYLLGFAGDGRLAYLHMLPFRIHRFRLERASEADTDWLRTTMDRECGRFGSGVSRKGEMLQLSFGRS